MLKEKEDLRVEPEVIECCRNRIDPISIFSYSKYFEEHFKTVDYYSFSLTFLESNASLIKRIISRFGK